MKTAFTLAEVLITLGIIGVVAAMTIPTLISKYQKHVYYTQFMKAATVLENAINQYDSEHGCGECDKDGYDCNNLCILDDGINFAADKLSEYMNVVQWITDDNYRKVCEGYKKLPPAALYDGTDRNSEDWDYNCKNDLAIEYNKGHAFITNDGMLFNFATDDGAGLCSDVDTNGTKGPNIYGRDIFSFCLFNPPSRRWGAPEEESEVCFGDNKVGWNCGIRLLQEGKMNY